MLAIVTRTVFAHADEADLSRWRNSVGVVRLRPMRTRDSPDGVRIIRGQAFLPNLRRGHCELGFKPETITSSRGSFWTNSPERI
jgi:hypothetical protein